MAENQLEKSKKKPGRPKNLPGYGKEKIVSLRITKDEYAYLSKQAKSFSNSKYCVALYLHSKVFDNYLQQVPGDQLISSINSIVSEIERSNNNLADIAIQIEKGIKDKSVPPSILDTLKDSMASHSDNIRKLQRQLTKLLRAATVK